jgi:hypothetical protein
LSLRTRLARLELSAPLFEELLARASTEAIERFLDLTCTVGGRAVLSNLSDAQLEELASGDDSFLDPAERALLSSPLGHSALEILKN